MRKTKKFAAILLSALILSSSFSALPVSAATVGNDTTVVSVNSTLTSGNYQYKVLDDNTICISRYIGEEENVTIPAKINGLTVTTIGKGAFVLTGMGCLNIPASITDIKPNAFKFSGFNKIEVDKNNLNYTSINGVLFSKDKTVLLAYPKENSATSYIIPDGVKIIESTAFMGTSNLNSIVIPNGVTTIKENAFYLCSNLKNVSIPTSVKSIGEYAFDFSACTKENYGYYIGNCLIGADNEINGNFTIKDGTRLVADSALREIDNLGNISIPASVEIIGDCAFLNFSSESLKNITVANENKYFSSENGVLFNKNKTELLCYPCGKNETTYTVPNTVTKLAKVSFSGCKLNKLNLPNNLKYIDESAFTETSLKTLSIPESVEYIGKYTFLMSGIETVNIPKRIATIEEGTFSCCINLKSVTIDNNIKHIGDYAFSACYNLSDINISNNVTSIGKGAFQSTIIQKIELPASLESIGGYAFNNCQNLQEVTIPNKEIKIDNRAFYNCPKLNTVAIPAKVKEIGKNAFGYQGNIFDEEDYEYGEENSIQDFKITGYSNTAAETYAKENGFEFISLGEQILTGDANQDGTVNIKDVTYLQMHIAGNKNTDGSSLIDETNKQLFDSIDMNNDGKLTVNDVTALQTYLAQNN
ncbi:leucine-rich repeat protein [uncultured Ruminococcus sp.]|uniref:leucine-rich repeat protein n=1 Tax=uncultured Ruminococcus sp. TaxID=165186 RepID=UPI0025EC1D70|nr:leucine-rich repeat protein [uncultured Ruminococcus sp.]